MDGDFGDPDNFVGTFFQSRQPAWGTNDHPNNEVIDVLNRAERETDLAARTALYQEANRLIADWIPGVPYVHTIAGLGVRGERHRLRPEPGVAGEEFDTVSFGEEPEETEETETG